MQVANHGCDHDDDDHVMIYDDHDDHVEIPDHVDDNLIYDTALPNVQVAFAL